MKPQEFRASAALAAVFFVRLLGLFMIYPVFAAYAGTLAGANPYLIHSTAQKFHVQCGTVPF